MEKGFVWATIPLALASVLVGVGVTLAPEIADRSVESEQVLFIFVGLAAAVSLAALLLSRGTVGSTRSGFTPTSAEARERAKLLQTYPDDSKMKELWPKVCELSPFAASSLRSFMDVEIDSLTFGFDHGLYVRTGGTPWNEELVRKGLVIEVDPPRTRRERTEDCYYVLTSEGRLLGRMLVANEVPIPSALLKLFGSPDFYQHREVLRASVTEDESIKSGPGSEASPGTTRATRP